MKQVLLKKGLAFTADVPIPQPGIGEVLVQTQCSCLSIGTELTGLRSSGIPIWRRAYEQPEKIVTAINMISEAGLHQTMRMINEKRESEHVTGYSASGIVVSIGKEILDVSVGDYVACSGAKYAHHAEFVRVPRNLCVPIPKAVDFESASTVTLGAIALQGIRRAQPTLGETFVVLVLGILGQLTAQMLLANGCNVIGIDTDLKRIDIALSLGMQHGIHSINVDAQTVAKMTHGYGADGVIITASSLSDEVVSQAFQMSRKKGRVVLVGDVGLNLKRSDFYTKEIDFLISSSYGPGRYDQRYEEQGLDYPIGYVRWTENRNMQAYLELIEKHQVNINPLIDVRFPIERSAEAYAAISSKKSKPLLALLKYPDAKESRYSVSKQNNLKSSPHKSQKIRIALIGAGNFARSSHLPNIKFLNKYYELRAVVSRNGPTARNVAMQFGADYATSDPHDVFTDPDVDAVLITTRHDSHGYLALKALEAGKHVLLEKPTTLSRDELSKLNDFFEKIKCEKHKETPLLLTGYNRRFSKYIASLKKLVEQGSSPFILNYRVNAGFIPKDHWVHKTEGGGRNIGEACHIYDVFTYLANESVKSVSAHAIKISIDNKTQDYYARNDNFVATFSFADGSVANLIYTALGNNDVPKETAELFIDGKIAILNDYKSLIVHGSSWEPISTKVQEKGLRAELEKFACGIKTGEWPIPWWQQVQVSEMAFNVEDMIFD